MRSEKGKVSTAKEKGQGGGGERQRTDGRTEWNNEQIFNLSYDRVR